MNWASCAQNNGDIQPAAPGYNGRGGVELQGELMALSIGIAVRCDGCIAYHVHKSLQAEATYEEIVKTIGVAILMEVALR